jgi:stearoyl-CoA desaturase (delta-9 desaturase)
MGSIRWWCRDHRAHHRYTDTDKDPYSAHKGLFYSHIGWIVLKKSKKHIGRVDISDLNEDGIVVWQHRNFFPLSLFMGLVLPCLISGIGWNDWFGGFLYAGILRAFALQQSTFCVNSLAHYLGEQPFADRHTPRNHIITALITFGEGYHNFHHEFPSDYRNAIRWYQYDPTKWLIWSCEWFGLAYDLKRFRSVEIEKSRLQQIQKHLDEKKMMLDWGTPIDQLPAMSWDQFQAETKKGRSLIAITGVIHDVSSFVKDHPGGESLIRSGIGNDSTAVFNGGIYEHSNAAHNILATMRVAVLQGGDEIAKSFNSA